MIISDLQLNLIVAGAAAVAAVWGYNLWQERKYRQAAEQSFRESRADVLLQNQEPEPEYGRDLTADVHPDDERLEPIFAEPVVEPMVLSHKSEPDEALADPTIELVVPFRFEQVVSGQRLLEFITMQSGRLTKRLQWIIGDDSGTWKMFDGDGSGFYRDLRATLPLADRQGAIGEDELVVFIAAAQALAREGGGDLEFVAADECLAHARALDDLCASVDVQVAVHVIHRSGDSFACTKLRGLAEASGLKLAADGSFYLVDEAGTPLFSLANHGAAPFDPEEMQNTATQGVTFWLDVPRVSDGAQVFDRLVAVAHQLAHGLDGVLVDDQHHPLADNVLSGIRTKVAEIQATMAESGLPAGGRRALRLFV